MRAWYTREGNNFNEDLPYYNMELYCVYTVWQISIRKFRNPRNSQKKFVGIQWAESGKRRNFIGNVVQNAIILYYVPIIIYSLVVIYSEAGERSIGH